jgi:hypothetical protein
MGILLVGIDGRGVTPAFSDDDGGVGCGALAEVMREVPSTSMPVALVGPVS